VGLCVYRGIIAIVQAQLPPLLLYQTFLSASAYHFWPLSTYKYDSYIKSTYVLDLLQKIQVIYSVKSVIETLWCDCRRKKEQE